MLHTGRIVQDLQEYLSGALSISVSAEVWQGAGGLPPYLREPYEYYRGEILGMPCLLMIAAGGVAATPAALGKHVDAVRQHWSGPVVYVSATISPYCRKRLIEQHVPFVVPGKQMYLPPLGLDLREHFAARHAAPVALSPAAQVVMLYALLNDLEPVVTPTALSSLLGYTRMTMSRAFDELETSGLADVTFEGRLRVLRFEEPRAALWTRARPLMRSPVKSRLTVAPRPEPPLARDAGLTALAAYGMLAAPPLPTCAVSATEWNAIRDQHSLVETDLAEAHPHACELQIWSYSPSLLSRERVVDPLSLFLSLQDDPDERVEMALQHLIEALPW